MNLVKAIMEEHSKLQCIKIVRFVGNNPDRFSDLVTIFLAGPYRVTQRAAWPLSVCIEHHSELITPHLRMIVRKLEESDIHDAVKRNVVRLLQFIEIPKSLQGRVVKVCFLFLTDTKEPIAVRVFAMSVLANLAKKLPELKNELIPIIEDQLPFGSAGFISRGKKVLKELMH